MHALSHRLRAAAIAVALTPFAPCQGLLLANQTPDPANTSLYAWYAAWQGVNGVITPIDGGAVDSWSDLSSNGRDLVRVDAATNRRPTFRLGVAGESPFVEFDGDDYLWADDATEFGTLASDKTVFFVARVRSGDGGYVFDGTSASGRNAVFTGQTSSPYRWNTYAGAASAAGPIVAHDTFEVHAVTFDSAGLEHFVNGASIYSGASTIADLQGLTLGARYTLDHEFVGEIAEVLIYDRELTTTERQSLEGYLLTRYPPQPAPTPPAATEVFAAGNGYPEFRIPAFLRTQSGVLLAFAEGRQTLNDHSQNDIVLRRSFDGGATWGALQVLHDDGANSLNNPCVVQIESGTNAGRILVMYQRYPAGCHVSCVVPGLTGPNICRSFVVHSDDDGATWSAPLEITSQVKRPTLVKAMNSGPGIGIQKRRAPNAGRILFPFNQLDTSGHWWNYAVFSDDGGATWSYGDVADDSQTPGQGNEVQFVERIDGSVLLNARSHGGTRHRKQAVSSDGGATWGLMSDHDKLNEPQVMASVHRFTDPLDGYRNRIVYAGPNSRRSRSNGTVQISYDDGATWSESKMVHGGFYAYSCLGLADEHRIGLLYEASGYSQILFSAMTVEWLSDQRDCLENGAHGANYGVGCPGTGGWVPYLEVTGCASPGGAVTFRVSNALGSALGILGFGSGNGVAPFGACDVQILPLLGTSDPWLASGTLPGSGAIDLPLALPIDLLPMELTVQAFLLDVGVSTGLAASNAAEVVIF